MLAEELPARTSQIGQTVKCVNPSSPLRRIACENLKRYHGLKILPNVGFEVIVLLGITSQYRAYRAGDSNCILAWGPTSSQFPIPPTD